MYNAVELPSCYARDTNLQKVKCLDPDWAKLEREVSALISRRQELKKISSWQETDAWKKSVDTKCAAQSPRNCLLQAYKDKKESLIKEVQDLNAEHSSQVALRARLGDPAKAKILIEKIAGVYKRHFKNGDVSGRSYQSEDIVEIVGVDRRSAYIRMDLQFFNGHVCSFAEILTYRANDHLAFQEEGCLVELTVTPSLLAFSAEGPTCQNRCGMRGTLNAYEVKRSTRRPIRYMNRLFESREYKAAVEKAKSSIREK